MSRGLWDRFIRFLGFGPDDEEEEEVPRSQVAAAADWPEEPSRAPRRARASGEGNVVPLAASRPGAVRVLVVEPKSFDDVQGIADQLRNRRPVILNLESVDKDTAQRVLNFLHGAIYALGGDTQKVAAGIFFFAPPGVDVAHLTGGMANVSIVGGAHSADDAALEQRLSLFAQATANPSLGEGVREDKARERPEWDWRR